MSGNNGMVGYWGKNLQKRSKLNPFDFEYIHSYLKNRIKTQVSVQNFAVLANVFTKRK